MSLSKPAGADHSHPVSVWNVWIRALSDMSRARSGSYLPCSWGYQLWVYYHIWVRMLIRRPPAYQLKKSPIAVTQCCLARQRRFCTNGNCSVQQCYWGYCFKGETPWAACLTPVCLACYWMLDRFLVPKSKPSAVPSRAFEGTGVEQAHTKSTEILLTLLKHVYQFTYTWMRNDKFSAIRAIVLIADKFRAFYTWWSCRRC